MALPKIKYQQVQFTITAANAVHPIELDSDKLYNTVTGVNIILTNDLARFATLKLDINNQEIFPENFEVLRLRFREQAPFGFDYHQLNEPAAGSKITGKYTDKGTAANYPYTVIVSFRYENTEVKK